MAERKKYIEVKIPILNSTTKILGTPESLNNKTIKIDLSRQLRGKGLIIKLRISNDKESLIAIPNTLELSTPYIKRMMRKRISYIEDSFKAKCTDIEVTIKPFLITRKKVSKVVRKNLRNTTKKLITEYIKEKDYNQIFQEILDGTLQKTMLPKLKKIYPLSLCEIRKFGTKELEKIDITKISENTLTPEPETEDMQKG